MPAEGAGAKPRGRHGGWPRRRSPIVPHAAPMTVRRSRARPPAAGGDSAPHSVAGPPLHGNPEKSHLASLRLPSTPDPGTMPSSQFGDDDARNGGV
ncbi:MAG: hypothetical protein U0232_28435 [Thermomicrobiales bacterium]